MHETDYNYYKTMTLFNLFPKSSKFKYEYTSNNKEKNDNYCNIKENTDINDNIYKRKMYKNNSKTYFTNNEKKNLIYSSSRVPLYNLKNYVPAHSGNKLHKTSSNYFCNQKIRINKNKNLMKNKINYLNNETDNIEIEKEISLENIKHKKSGKNLVSEHFCFKYNNQRLKNSNEAKLMNQGNVTKKNNYLTDDSSVKTYRIYNMNNNNSKNSKKSMIKFNQNDNYNKKYYKNQLPLLNKISNNQKQISVKGISNIVLNSEKNNKKKVVINKNDNFFGNLENNEENKANNIVKDNNNLINFDYNYRMNKINKIFSSYNSPKNLKTENDNKCNNNNDKNNKQMNSTNSDFGNNNIIFSRSNSKLGIINKKKKSSLHGSNNIIKTVHSTNNITWKFKNKKIQFHEKDSNKEENENDSKKIKLFSNYTNTNFFMDNNKRLSVNHEVKYSTNAKNGFLKLENSLKKDENNLYLMSYNFNTIMNSNSNLTSKNKINKLEKYNIGKVLGKGAYATVKLIVNRLTNEKFAMKIYEKSKLNDRLKKRCVYKEIEILKRIEHKNIARLYETIFTDTQVLIIQEYVKGISLRDYYNKEIRNQKGISEHKAKIFKKIFRQIFDAMNYLHSNYMAHRDIKLENILLAKDYEIKIIDFGFGMLNLDNKVQHFFCGTPNYMPPEIVEKRGYIGQKADLWSLGILVYKIYCADFPFKGRNEKELYKSIKRCEFSIINYVPEKVKKVIRALIEYDPNKRPSCKEVLESEWLRK